MNPLDVTASQVLDTARTHLNDELGINWPDTRLFPKLQEAHRELRTELVLQGVPVIHQVNAIMDVPALPNDNVNLDLSTLPGYPPDMIEPIWLKERQVNDQMINFTSMTECEFVPQSVKDRYLSSWAWIGESIWLRGALNNVQVMIRYIRNIPTPTVNTDSIGFIYGENFLSFRTAALAVGSIGNDQKNSFLTDNANKNLSKLMQIATKQLQNLPAKRRPYHRGRGMNRVLRGF